MTSEPDVGGSRSTLSTSVTLDRLTVPLALVSVYIIWGSTYLAIRIAVETFPPFIMGGIRYFIAGVLLYTFLRLRGAPPPTRAGWGAASIVGILLLIGGNGLVAFAEQSVASGLAAALIATVPVWAVVFAVLWRIRPSRLETFGVLLGFAGIALLSTGSGLHGHPLGAALLIVAPICWALGSVWSQRLPMPSSMMAAATEMLVGGGLMILLGLSRGERLTHMPSTSSLGAVLYLIVFGSLVAFNAYNVLLQRVRPALATSYAYVNPLVAIALGAALAGERITGRELVALFIVLTAVVLVIMGRQRKTT